ncbi:unnamed protein product [Parnassius mnemosyne]|uniref:Uncharacterized protein n=1 Tax=Parnassius mnemosyne TaxID=213953 RepID=A0AAV1K792_9NEOP
MFSTPPNNRIMSIKNREKLNERLENASELVLANDRVAGSLQKVEPSGNKVPSLQRSTKNESVTSATESSSSRLRRKQLELAAPEEKARIRMKLIDKKLEFDLAKMEGSRASECQSKTSQVNRSIKKQPFVNQQLETRNLQPSPSLQHKVAATATSEAATATSEAARAPYVDPVRAPAHHTPVDSILQLAHTFKDIMITSCSNQEERLLTRLSTPRELPAFSGDCIEWLHFKSAYEESTYVCQFSDFENLWRLRRALKGDAKEAVTDLLIGNTSPAVVMEALELRFGQSDLIIQYLTSQMKKLSPLSTNYQHDIILFSMKVNNCVATLYALNQHDYLRSPELSATILSKLPSILLSK